MKKIRIFDIDGTIKHPGIDIWYMTTKSIIKGHDGMEGERLSCKQMLKIIDQEDNVGS